MSALRALVVGCGSIGGGFDAPRPDDADPLTHAGAYRRDARFALAACADPDESRRRGFMQRWQVPAGFASLADVPGSERFDVISVCTPTARHAEDLRHALSLRPKLVFCEKPVSPTAAETEALAREYRQAGVLLAVNYTRRWDPEVARLREDIRQSRRGALRAAQGWYNKGLLNNGSHLIDLLLHLLGPLKVVRAGTPVEDHEAGDPSMPAWLEAAGGTPLQLACGNAADFSIFELQLLFSDAMVTMEDGGMAWRERRASASAHFAGYRALDAGARRAGGYGRALPAALDNIAGAIGRGVPLASDVATALATQRICEQVRRA